ncbi:MAG: hypothetical protein JXK95_12275 [Bacteroidales bacterium]|nr:hypothetical protein [Bacteroidales bacterium]
MSCSIFWGIILILIGLSLILKVVFNVDFPFFKFLFAFFLIYLGIRIFIGKDFRLFSDVNDEHTVIFSQRTINNVTDGKEYNVIFGSGIFDLRDYQSIPNEDINIKLNTIFGNTEVLINDSIPLEIEAHTVFAGSRMPDGNVSAFGEVKFKNDSYIKSPLLKIESNTVFGGFLVKKK